MSDAEIKDAVEVGDAIQRGAEASISMKSAGEANATNEEIE